MLIKRDLYHNSTRDSFTADVIYFCTRVLRVVKYTEGPFSFPICNSVCTYIADITSFACINLIRQRQRARNDGLRLHLAFPAQHERGVLSEKRTLSLFLEHPSLVLRHTLFVVDVAAHRDVTPRGATRPMGGSEGRLTTKKKHALHIHTSNRTSVYLSLRSTGCPTTYEFDKYINEGFFTQSILLVNLF